MRCTAVGEYVVLKPIESKSISGLITAKVFIVDSIGTNVPKSWVDVSLGDTVVFNRDEVKMTLENGWLCIHYSCIYGITHDRVSNSEFGCYVNDPLL